MKIPKKKGVTIKNEISSEIIIFAKSNGRKAVLIF